MNVASEVYTNAFPKTAMIPDTSGVKSTEQQKEDRTYTGSFLQYLLFYLTFLVDRAAKIPVGDEFRALQNDSMHDITDAHNHDETVHRFSQIQNEHKVLQDKHFVKIISQSRPNIMLQSKSVA